MWRRGVRVYLNQRWLSIRLHKIQKTVSNNLQSSSNVVYLNEPTLIICNAIPTMGVLCGLTVGRDKIDQSRPIGSTVNQWSKCLVGKESLAAVERHHDCIIGPSSDFKQGTNTLTVFTKSVSDDMAVIWVGAASCWIETVRSARSAADVCRVSLTLPQHTLVQVQVGAENWLHLHVFGFANPSRS